MVFERGLREHTFEQLDGSQGYNSDSVQLEYINQVLAVVKALDLDVLDGWEVPPVLSKIDEYYRQFLSDVDHITVQIRIRNARRAKKYSVALNQATKKKIRHHLNQIRQIVDELNVSDGKREALYDKLSELENEVNRDRTRFDANMALILECVNIAGTAADKIEPLRKFIDSITGLIKAAKDQEDAATVMLGAPPEKKKIEPPRKQLGPPTQSNEADDLDDDIPF